MKRRMEQKSKNAISISIIGGADTPIFEYQYNNKTFRVAHRISSFTPNCTYKVNDVVELRVYEDKPDKAIVNSKKNLIMPLVSGISSIILGIVFVIIYALFK